MSGTIEVLIKRDSWTLVASSGSGYFSNTSGVDVIVRESVLDPGSRVDIGHIYTKNQLTLYNDTIGLWMRLSNDSGKAVNSAVITLTQPVNLSNDYLIEVGRGNVPGAKLVSVQAKNRNVGTAYEDIWGADESMVYPAFGVSESWEILSNNVNDILTGTGAWTVSVDSLDDNHNLQTNLVNLNGTTPVAIPGTHTRPKSATVIAAGATTETNLGKITIRVSGGGDIRNIIQIDEGGSQDIHYTTEAGKTTYIIQTFTLFGKDDSGEARLRVKPFGANSAWITIAPVPIYQNIIEFEVKALLPLPEKWDLNGQAKSDSGSTANVNAVLELLVLDN